MKRASKTFTITIQEYQRGIKFYIRRPSELLNNGEHLLKQLSSNMTNAEMNAWAKNLLKEAITSL